MLIIMSLCAAIELSAQDSSSAPSGPIKQGLTRFHSIDVDAPIKLSLIKIEEYDIPYIV